MTESGIERTGVDALRQACDSSALGSELYDRVRRLYPICRSITGNGLRETLALIGSEIDIRVHEVPTGTQVFDWTIPKEWNIRDAYIKDASDRKIVDFQASNLHVVNYSVPVRGRFTFEQLRPHLFSIPERPDWIPYKTSYYRETWGFCLSDRQLQSMDPTADYEVCIDASLESGRLTMAECVLPGETPDEVLVSCHVCHPSLCNDNLSGVSVAVTLARLLARASRRYTYRFLFVPGTIGAIAWLALNERLTNRIKHGLVLACIGDRGKSTYKRSRQSNAEIDRVMKLVLADSHEEHEIQQFSPYGYDERQYCSPGFNLPVGVLSRTPHGRFPEYHSSADNLDLVDPAAMANSLDKCLAAFEILEGNRTYVSLNSKCEPQLGKRGLYRSMGGHGLSTEEAMLWVLNMSDGHHSLLDIAEQSGLDFRSLNHAAKMLSEASLLSEMRGTAVSEPT
jgi:aminopeptidase-like protein